MGKSYKFSAGEEWLDLSESPLGDGVMGTQIKCTRWGCIPFFRIHQRMYVSPYHYVKKHLIARERRHFGWRMGRSGRNCIGHIVEMFIL